MLKFTTHANDTIKTVGTSWTFRTIQATFNEMCAAFGDPIHYEDGKMQFEWCLYFVEEGVVATVYNWKNPITDPDIPIVWHIGAKKMDMHKAPVLVHQAFREIEYGPHRSAA